MITKSLLACWTFGISLVDSFFENIAGKFLRFCGVALYSIILSRSSISNIEKNISDRELVLFALRSSTFKSGDFIFNSFFLLSIGLKVVLKFIVSWVVFKLILFFLLGVFLIIFWMVSSNEYL